jgi:hypothetical protein
MSDYTAAIMHRLQHPKPERPQHAPYKHQPINYGTKVQFFAPSDNSAPLTDTQKIKLQQVVGCILYYTGAVDPTMRVSLSTLAPDQEKCTEATAEAMVELLSYCATYPKAEVRYHSSDMVLHAISDASY